MPLIKYGDAQPITAIYEAETTEEFDVETRKQLEAVKAEVEKSKDDVSESSAN